MHETNPHTCRQKPSTLSRLSLSIFDKPTESNRAPILQQWPISSIPSGDPPPPPHSSTQLVSFATLVIAGGILLLLTGMTLTATVLGLIFFVPTILISSPIWVPLGTLLFIAIAGFLSFFGFGVAAAAAASWMYRYFRGFHQPGSDRVDYARTRIADTASHVKDYAIEYGGYLHGKVKDAAPGA